MAEDAKAKAAGEGSRQKPDTYVYMCVPVEADRLGCQAVRVKR